MQMNKRNQDTAQSSRTPRQEFPSDTNSINGKWKWVFATNSNFLIPPPSELDDAKSAQLRLFFSISFIVWNF